MTHEERVEHIATMVDESVPTLLIAQCVTNHFAAVERETLERAALMCESLAAQSHTLGEYANEGQRLHCAAAIRALTDQKETA